MNFEGTVVVMTTQAADGQGEVLGQVIDRLAEPGGGRVNQTGLRVPGQLHCMHCARTEQGILITYHPPRGRADIDATGVPSRFPGITVHDAGAPEDAYLDLPSHACCAQVVRELQDVV
jgi:transposase